MGVVASHIFRRNKIGSSYPSALKKAPKDLLSNKRADKSLTSFPNPEPDPYIFVTLPEDFNEPCPCQFPHWVPTNRYYLRTY